MPKSANTCPMCGLGAPRRKSMVETVAGEMTRSQRQVATTLKHAWQTGQDGCGGAVRDIRHDADIEAGRAANYRHCRRPARATRCATPNVTISPRALKISGEQQIAYIKGNQKSRSENQHEPPPEPPPSVLAFECQDNAETKGGPPDDHVKEGKRVCIGWSTTTVGGFGGLDFADRQGKRAMK